MKTRRRILAWLVRALAIAVAVTLILSVVAVLPLRWIDPPVTAFMLGDPQDPVSLRTSWTSWADIGESLPLAVVAAEDQRFLDHHGFDLRSIRDSVKEYTAGESLRGASTISQQVAKNLFLWRGRSFVRKGIEAWLTVVIEVAYPKKRILELHLNIAEFGPGIYGVGAASEAFFGKTPGELSDSEAALLAAVLPNPIRLQVNRPTAYVRDRQRWIYDQMQRLRQEQRLASIIRAK